VLRRARWNDAQAAPSSRGQPVAARAIDDCGVDLILSSIAVYGGAGRSGYHRANAITQGSPHQSIDQGVFQVRQGGLSSGSQPNQPIRILATRMGH
jgi:hypothetical protein